MMVILANSSGLASRLGLLSVLGAGKVVALGSAASAQIRGYSASRVEWLAQLNSRTTIGCCVFRRDREAQRPFGFKEVAI